jgi:hypothetical protein
VRFKIGVLRFIPGAAAETQLIAALKLGEAFDIDAAMSLCAHGNALGKPLLLEHISEAVSRSQAFVAPLLPLLEPGDYDQLLDVMNGELAKVQSERAQRLAELKAILNDPDAAAAAKAHAKDSLAYIAWPQSGLMNRWLPILGATRNPKGHGLYLWALNDPQSNAHVAAIEALGNIGDSQTTELLIGRLSTADSDELDAIIRTLGKTNNPRIAESLAAVVSEPTLVSTKLAWITAMSSVAPDRISAVVREWTDSPSAELVNASRAALGERNRPH